MAERVAALEAAAQLLMVRAGRRPLLQLNITWDELLVSSNFLSLSLLQSPPFAVPEQERKAAELAFVEFKKAASPYAECKNILGEAAG